MEEIKSIFQNAGYTPKKCARIGKLIEPMVALAYDNTVWIATSGVPVSDAMDAIQTLVTVFDDTLGDTANDMSVHASLHDRNPVQGTGILLRPKYTVLDFVFEG